jgi:surface antigen
MLRCVFGRVAFSLSPFFIKLRPLMLTAALFAGEATLAQDTVLQCVPYARQVSGIQIYGDAHSWWDAAAGRYHRDNRPRPGAVMAFPAHGRMTLGHVATVSRVLDSRRVLLDHANWSVIDGQKGHIERDALAVDVSDANDWSAVRVWYTPQGALGTTVYPVHGFIHPAKPKAKLIAATGQGPSRAPNRNLLSSRTTNDLLQAAQREASAVRPSPQRNVAKTPIRSLDQLLAAVGN